MIERRSLCLLVALCLGLAGAPASVVASKAKTLEGVLVCPDGWHLVGIASHRARAKAIVPVCARSSTDFEDLKNAINAQPRMPFVFSGKGARAAAAGSVLTKETFAEVHHVATAEVVGRYIGETEKNLETIFARAEFSVIVVFFDETDALFGKRTEANDAHDRYANQEVAYLLSRIEDADGVILLASNYRRRNILHFCAKKSCAAVAKTVS